MVSFLFLYELGRWNLFRYQPMPVGRYAPQKLDGSFSSKGPSMLQSCGRSKILQSASDNLGTSAPGKSPLWNLQPRSKFSRSLCPVSSVRDSSKEEPKVGNTETNAAVPTTPFSSSRRFIEPLSGLTFFISSPSSRERTVFPRPSAPPNGLVHSDNLPLLRLGAARSGFLYYKSGQRAGSAACVQCQSTRMIHEVEVSVARRNNRPLLFR